MNRAIQRLGAPPVAGAALGPPAMVSALVSDDFSNARISNVMSPTAAGG